MLESSGPDPAIPFGPHKRKALRIDEIFEAKRSNASHSLYAMRHEFTTLLAKKKAYCFRQRRSSLLVDPCPVDEENVMNEFGAFYRKVSNAPMAMEEHRAQIELIEQVIKESTFIEWPRSIPGLSPIADEDTVDIDSAPLIHRARNVVKCRTSHPTMRVKVSAIGKSSDQPKTVEAFFRATLVKIAEGHEPRQVAGRIILTQREGTAATKCSDQNGAIVNGDGRLVASQAATDTHTYLLLDRYGELQAKTTPLKFENGCLCATFPEMGVTLNSMVDRRQLATRYAIQVEVAINIDNKLIVQHTLLSHPFLIAITNDQTEPLLLSIYWHRMLNVDIPDPVDVTADLPALPWKVIRQTVTHFVKAQYSMARSLHRTELLHVQCMILLPRFLKLMSQHESDRMENFLFGNVMDGSSCSSNIEKIRNRLLEEEIRETVLIEKREFVSDVCYSLLDMSTPLEHTVFQWLFKATEMIMDVGHKLCPSPVEKKGEKKPPKTKKQMAASDEYQTMGSLFNKGLISFSSSLRVTSVYQSIATSSTENEQKALMLRFCDENAGYLSLAYGMNEGKPILGSISSDQLKDFKQGLPEVLMDEQYPSKFDKLVKLEFDTPSKEPGKKNGLSLSLPRKKSVFHNYNTMRLKNDSIAIMDVDTVRVNPLTGDTLDRVPAPSASPPDESINNMGILREIKVEQGDPSTSSPSLSSPSFLFSFLQQQLSTPFIPSQMTSSSSSPPLITSPPHLMHNPLLAQMQMQQILKGMQGFQDINSLQVPVRSSSRSSSEASVSVHEEDEQMDEEEREEDAEKTDEATPLEKILQQTMREQGEK